MEQMLLRMVGRARGKRHVAMYEYMYFNVHRYALYGRCSDFHIVLLVFLYKLFNNSTLVQCLQ